MKLQTWYMSVIGKHRRPLRRLSLGVASRMWWLPLTATGLLADRGSRRRWSFAPAIVALSGLASTTGKLLIRRPRPGAHSRVPIGRLRAASFPSTHAACAFAIAGWMRHSHRRAWLHFIAVILGYSRVRGRVHHPSDVVAGGILGYAIGRCADWIWSVLADTIERQRYGNMSGNLHASDEVFATFKEGIDMTNMRSGMRRLVIAALLMLSLILALSTPAEANGRTEGVHVSPSSGSPSTVFVLTFRTPERTSNSGSGHRHDVITASVRQSTVGCVKSIYVAAPALPSKTLVRILLDSRKLGGSWCPGVYHGRITDLQDTAPRVVGRFTLDVKLDTQPRGRSDNPPPQDTSPQPSVSPPRTSPPSVSPPSTFPPAGLDTTPPIFTGLQSALACTSGPIEPSEMIPYTLTWQAATDNATPSSEIVYDIFLAFRSGSENFSQPTWTTSPGVTTFTTPGLPSEAADYFRAGGGIYYFVVRARDQAGNEDQNQVQRRGYQVCE